MKLDELLRGVQATYDPLLGRLDITSVTTDSRNVKKGSLFVAIEGFRQNGHDFIEEAVKKGAGAFVTEKGKSISRGMKNVVKVKDSRKALSKIANNFFGSPSERLYTIGITGTNGKTTISYLIQSMFEKANIPCGVIGTIENKLGKENIRSSITTPDALNVNSLLVKMLQAKLDVAVLEVSSHGLDQKRVNDISFDVAVFTNLTHEHLDYHGTLENYFKTKMKLFDRLKKGGICVTNVDDSYGLRVKQKLTGKKCIGYGLKKTADIRAEILETGLNGSVIEIISGKSRNFKVSTKLVGLHNISNILGAVSVAMAKGIGIKAIKDGIGRMDNVPGRLESVNGGQDFKVFVDYAHTHDALENVLTFLDKIKKGSIITVFGCGGERDRKKRPLMGKVAQEYSDFTILTSDNPRTEDPERIMRDIQKGLKAKKGTYEIIKDRKKAIERALKEAGANDIVLIAGKGHESGQAIGKIIVPFDDKKIAEEILKNDIRRRIKKS